MTIYRSPQKFLSRIAAFSLLVLLGASGVGSVHAQDPSLRFGGLIPPEVDTIYERGLTWLAGCPNAGRHWKGNNEGCGVDGICLMAFLASGEDPNYGRHASTIQRAIRSMIQKQDATTGYLPNSMYHHGFATLALSEAYGTVDETLLWQGGKAVRSIGQTLDLAIRCAATSQKKNQFGGWRYSPDATDADTSVTGAVLMGLLAARNAGMDVSDEIINGAMEYMRRSTGGGWLGGVLGRIRRHGRLDESHRDFGAGRGGVEDQGDGPIQGQHQAAHGEPGAS